MMNLFQDYPKNVPVKVAAELMGVSPQFVRIGLQQNRFPFGAAVKLSTQWSYHIAPIALESYFNGEVQK